jgi:hypothetical protein
MTYSKKDCHNGPNLVLSHRGVDLYAGSANEAEYNFDYFDLVISLYTIKPRKQVAGNIACKPLQRLVQAYNHTDHLELYWPDMGVPNLDQEFWGRLAAIIRKRGRDRERREKVYKVMVHCMAGHGRTGTALAILLYYISEYNKGDIVKVIRKAHCKKCVESSSQLNYIEAMTGIKLDKDTKASKVYISGTSKVSNANFKTLDELLAEYNKKNIPVDNDVTLAGTGYRGIKPITEEELEIKRRKKEIELVKAGKVNPKGEVDFCYKSESNFKLHIRDILSKGKCDICHVKELEVEDNNNIDTAIDIISQEVDMSLLNSDNNQDCYPREIHEQDMMVIGYCRSCGMVNV